VTFAVHVFVFRDNHPLKAVNITGTTINPAPENIATNNIIGFTSLALLTAAVLSGIGYFVNKKEKIPRA